MPKKDTTSDKEPKQKKVKIIKCKICELEIEGEAIEFSYNGQTVKHKAHKSCYKKHRETVQDKELLFNCIRDTFFAVNFPPYMATCLTNLHKTGTRYGKDGAEFGFPYIVIYTALKKAERDLTNYIQYAEKNNTIKDAQHKSNIILKAIEKYLESSYEEWLMAKTKSESQQIDLSEPEEETKKCNISLPNKKLIDY